MDSRRNGYGMSRLITSFAFLVLVATATIAQAQSQTVVPTSDRATAAQADRPPSSMLLWTQADKERWFRATEQVQPARLIGHGPYVRPLPSAGRTISPTWTYKGSEWSIDRYMKEYHVSGLLVMREGKILLERYGLGRTPDERWTSFSVSKSITSLLAGAAVAEGKLRLEDTVVQHVPQLKGSAYEQVSVRNLLMMASGVKWYEDYADPKSDIIRLSFEKSNSADPLLSYLAKQPRVKPAGSKFLYNSAETHLAGRVIAAATGKTLSDYLSEKIWKPYGMEADAYWLLDDAGFESAGCCLAMTLRDFGRVGQFALENGVARGKQTLPPDWITESTKVQIANGHPAPAGYGYFWWIGARAYEASGIFGQSILVYPKERIVIALNSAWPVAENKELSAALNAMHGAVHDAAAPDFPPTMKR